MTSLRRGALRSAALGVVAVLACACDGPITPTPSAGPLEDATGLVPATSLFVEVSFGKPSSLRSGLIEGEPATQRLQLTARGRVWVEDGTLESLAGTMAVRDDKGTVVTERQLDSLFVDTPILTPGVSLVFDGIELDFDAPVSAIADAGGEVTAVISGVDAFGQTVSAQATAPVSPDDATTAVSACVPDETTACALDDRFRIEVEWQDSGGNGGAARIPPAGRFSDGAQFFFADPSTPALLVRLLDHCDQGGHYGVGLTPSTDDAFTVAVTDTATGVTRPYSQPLGGTSAPFTDTEAFATCP